MASSDSQINKTERGRPKRAALPDVNIDTGAQSINTERAVGRRLNLDADQHSNRSLCDHLCAELGNFIFWLVIFDFLLLLKIYLNFKFKNLIGLLYATERRLLRCKQNTINFSLFKFSYSMTFYS